MANSSANPGEAKTIGNPRLCFFYFCVSDNTGYNDLALTLNYSSGIGSVFFTFMDLLII